MDLGAPGKRGENSVGSARAETGRVGAGRQQCVGNRTGKSRA